MDHVGEEFEAVISGVASFGFFAETVAHKCEGLVSINDLMYYDQFVHSEIDYSLAGTHTNIKFSIGDKIMIKVIAANLEKRQLDFAWVTDIKPKEKLTNAHPKSNIKSNRNTKSNDKTKKRKK
jgi:ribonuclease R